MSLKTAHLRKLLQLFYIPSKTRVALLRADVRTEMMKERGVLKGGGGDFHGPFWTDAKRHIFGLSNLAKQTEVRIRSNKRRERLYPELSKGFLRWWHEGRRWQNRRFEALPDVVKARFAIAELNAVVKVENLLSLKIDDDSFRLIYPYFSEEPVLNPEGARLAIWLLMNALPIHDPTCFRILDVLRGKSFGLIDGELRGDEKEIFSSRYSALLEEWQKLRDEYD